MASPEIKRCSSEKQITDELCSLVERVSNRAIRENGVFKVGVSGGSLVKFLCQGLSAVNSDWSKWRIFFCDERVVPFEDPESTYGLYKKGLMDSNIPITLDQIIGIDPSKELKEVAQDYIEKLKHHFKGEDLPRFDLLLLGMGPDGHTCSLFPNHKALKEMSKWITFIDDSPKPPPCRITLTYPVINNAKHCVFVSTGKNKAEVLKQVIEGNQADPLPAALVKPTNGQLLWILDDDSASLLTRQ